MRDRQDSMAKNLGQIMTTTSDISEPNAIPSRAIRPLVDEQAEAFAAIKRARAICATGKTVSMPTSENYARKSVLLASRINRTEGDAVEKWEAVLAEYAPVSNSFFAMRAAALWSQRSRLRALLSEQDRLQKLGGPDENWWLLVEQIDSLIVGFEIIESIEREDLIQHYGLTARRSRSKRGDLPRLPAYWRRFMVERAQASEQYRHPVAVLAATGCRPIELLWGVHLRLDFDHVVARVRGAKISATSGQVWRELCIALSAIPTSLIEKLSEYGEATIAVPSTAGLRSHLCNQSDVLWPERHRICPYHFRHALASDLRTAGWDREEIATALGHRVSETASQYGQRRRQGQGTSEPQDSPSILRGRNSAAVLVRAPKKNWSESAPAAHKVNLKSRFRR